MGGCYGGCHGHMGGWNTGCNGGYGANHMGGCWQVSKSGKQTASANQPKAKSTQGKGIAAIDKAAEMIKKEAVKEICKIKSETEALKHGHAHDDHGHDGHGHDGSHDEGGGEHPM